MSGGLVTEGANLHTTTGYHRLPKLPMVTIGSRWQPMVTIGRIGYHMLPMGELRTHPILTLNLGYEFVLTLYRTSLIFESFLLFLQELCLFKICWDR